MGRPYPPVSMLLYGAALDNATDVATHINKLLKRITEFQDEFIPTRLILPEWIIFTASLELEKYHPNLLANTCIMKIACGLI